jgi:hypothetical protein
MIRRIGKSAVAAPTHTSAAAKALKARERVQERLERIRLAEEIDESDARGVADARLILDWARIIQTRGW